MLLWLPPNIPATLFLTSICSVSTLLRNSSSITFFAILCQLLAVLLVFCKEQSYYAVDVEIVVDGGDSTEIAQQILQKKAGGINTFGDVEVVLPGAYDEDITIRFNRPTTIHTWFHLGITLSKTEAIPPNYVDLLRGVVLDNMEMLDAGDDVVPQQFMSELYKACSGISYIDIRLYTTEDAADEPTEYPLRSANITARQRAKTTEDMIEVEIDG